MYLINPYLQQINQYFWLLLKPYFFLILCPMSFQRVSPLTGRLLTRGLSEHRWMCILYITLLCVLPTKEQRILVLTHFLVNSNIHISSQTNVKIVKSTFLVF